MAYALWVLLLGGTIPTPLYPLYESRFHFSSTGVTVVFAVYAFGVLAWLGPPGPWRPGRGDRADSTPRSPGGSAKRRC